MDLALRRYMIFWRRSLCRLILQLSLLLLVLFVGGPLLLMGQPPSIASSGRSFFVALPAMGSTSDHVFRVTVTSRNDCQVNVRFVENDSTVTFTLASGGRIELVIPRNLISLAVNEYTSRRSLEITSTELVTVNATSDASALTDGYLALPTPSLGLDYYAASFPTPEIAFTYSGIIAVIATEDATHIAITPTVTTLSGNIPGTSYGVRLNRGEVYQILPKLTNGTDLTGTHITADKPVAVISGHRGATLPEGRGGAANGLLEMMPPVTDWGTRFIGFTYPQQEKGYYRVLAATAGTVVRVNNRPLDTLASLASLEFTSVDPVVIETSHPALVTQFTTHFLTDSAIPSGDPSMAVLNPTDSYAENFLWTSPSIAPRNWIKADSIVIPYDHYVVVTAHDSIRTSVALDGLPLALPIAHGNAPYHAAIVKIAAGPHRLSAAGPINAQLLGYNDYDAYSEPAGMRLRDPFRSGEITARLCGSSFDTTVILRNVGTEVVEVLGISITPLLHGRVVSPNFLPFSLAPNSTASLRLLFDSLDFGSSSGVVQLRTRTSGARPLEIPVTIVRDSLALGIEQALVRFDTLASTTLQGDTTIRIVNSGTGPVVVPLPIASAPFSVDPVPFPASLNPGDTLLVRLRFTPVRPGEVGGMIRFLPTPCGAPVTVAMSGYKRSPAVIEVMMGAIPPLLCPLPSSSEATLLIKNNGEEELHCDSIVVGGSDPFDFTVDLPSGGIVVASGDSARVTVRFTPQGTGRRSALLRIWDRVSVGGFYFQQIEGWKDSVGIGFTVDSLDFGVLQGCGGETSIEVDLLNGGTVDIRLDSVAVLDSLATESDDFSVTNSIAGAIAPGTRRKVMIRFRPVASGERRGFLLLHASPCYVVDTLFLRGVQEGAGLRATIDTLDFGIVPWCSSPIQGFISLVNSGTTHDTITEMRVTAAAGPFTSDDFTGTQIAPGDTLRIAVEFRGSGQAAASDSDYIGAIIVRAAPCDLERRVILRARVRATTIDSLAEIILPDFTVAGDYSGRTTLHNSSAIGIHLRDVIFDPLVSGLRVTSPIFPLTLAPGATIPIEVTATMPEEFLFRTTATVMIDSPCTAAPTFIVRNGSSSSIALELFTADTSATVDDLLGLPIRVRSARAIDERITVTGELRWRRHLLAPIALRAIIPGSDASITLDSIAGNLRIIRFIYHGPVPTAGTLALLDTRALLGDTDTTTLFFAKGSATSSDSALSFSVTLHDGTFRTLGICRIDGNRFIRLTTPTTFGRITPNPVGQRGYINVTLRHPSQVTVQLINEQGNEVFRTTTKELPTGQHRIELDFSTVPHGAYVGVVTVGDATEGQLIITN